MNNKPELSLIIPYYFQIDIVIETLKEVDSQVNFIKKNIEVLIIDSHTNSEKINIKKFNKNNQYLFIKIIQTENIIARKRNIGIKNAKADYIIFLDDDVVPKKSFIKKFLDLSTKNNKILTSCIVDFETPRNSYLYYRRTKENSVKKHLLSSEEISPIFATSMAFGVKKSNIVDNKQYFDENFIGYGWEDVDYFIEAQKKGLKIGISNICVIHKESDSYQRYFKKQILMGSWYKYFFKKHRSHAMKLRIHFIYKFLPFFKFSLPILKLIGQFLEYLIKKNLPFNKINFFIYEVYFKYGNILGMLSKSMKYE